MTEGIFDVKGSGLVSSLLRFNYFLIRVAWNEVRNSDDYILTIRRIVVFGTATLFINFIMTWNHIGFMLDDIFFSRWKQQSVETPLFLVGNARSGTTWLQRLLTEDSETFTALKTWEIIFAASISWRVLFSTLYKLDQFILRGFIYTILLKCEDACLGDRVARAASVHPVGLINTEEDEWLMVHAGYSQLIHFLFLLGSEVLKKLIMFDYLPNEYSKAPFQPLSDTSKSEIFRFYKQCVQRHMYYHVQLRDRENVIFLSKNPTFTLRIPTIYRTFPTARVVSLLRDPVQSVPSMISYKRSRHDHMMT